MNQPRPQPTPPDRTTIAVSIAGIIVLVVCFVIVYTQDDQTTRTLAILTTVLLWFFLRFWRRGRA